MDSIYIKRKFVESLSVEEQDLITLFSVICVEGISVDVVCNFIKPDNPQGFNSLVEKLCGCNWLFCDYQTIYIDPQIATAVLEISELKLDSIVKLLSTLKEFIEMKPLDDMISRQEYFVVARLFLTYLMRQWEVTCPDNCQVLSLFSEDVIAFATNTELSFFGNKRQPIHILEDRIDFKLLNFIIEKNPYCEGIANRLLGELYTKIFRYEEAKSCFHKASLILEKDAKLYLAESCMYENLSVLGKAFQMAYRAYIINKECGENDANIEICLYIAYLCAVNEAPRSSKVWCNIVRSLLGDREIPAGHIYSITLKEIEAMFHSDDKVLAFQILDSAELDIYRLYGGNAPEMARISYIRSLIDSEVGQLRRSNKEYRRYVETNHINYGVNVGGTAILYSAIINDNVIRGNIYTANIFAIKMQDLYAEGSNISPGVRLSQAFANCASNLAEGCYELSDAYLEVAKKIYENELMPNKEILSEITPIFYDGVPKSLLLIDESRSIHIVTINILLEEGRIDNAKELINSLLDTENDSLEYLKWRIHMGRVLIREGKLNDGIELWRDAVNRAPSANKFEITKEIAEWAQACDLIYDALGFYEEALQADIMVYGKTCDIAEALKCYADVLELCGLKEKSDEPWKQALMLMQSMGDKDGISLLYFSWGLAKQDYEAECLLLKAIEYWEPEHFNFDETLSMMFYYLCCAQAMQGKAEEARFSAHKAVELFPTDFPLHLIEIIEGYL